MPDREKVIKELESLRDICNAKSNMAIGNGKVAWAGYANKADDAIALLKEQERGGWISVKDRLPPNAEHLGAFCPRYLVKTEFGVTEGWYNPDRGNWFVLLWSMLGRFDLRDIDIERGDRPGVSARVAVTHWMPLPEPPEEVT